MAFDNQCRRGGNCWIRRGGVPPPACRRLPAYVTSIIQHSRSGVPSAWTEMDLKRSVTVGAPPWWGGRSCARFATLGYLVSLAMQAARWRIKRAAVSPTDARLHVAEINGWTGGVPSQRVDISSILPQKVAVTIFAPMLPAFLLSTALF